MVRLLSFKESGYVLSEMPEPQAHLLTKISFSFDDAIDKDCIYIASGETKTVEHDRESASTLLIFAAC